VESIVIGLLGRGEDEVNIVDYLAITAIRLFVPEVYYGIMDNKEVFYKNRVKVVYIRHL